MSGSGDVLILSKRFAGAVRAMADAVRASGRRPVLVSAVPDDPNGRACDAQIVVDWESAGIEQLTATVDRAGVKPVGVVNAVESLLPWQIEVARHYGLPGGEAARQVLLSKAFVRERMAGLGLSSLWFDSGTSATYDIARVPRYPVIVKPSRESGGSRLVRRANTTEELRTCLDEITRLAGSGFEIVLEEYIDGVEFSVDGPVTCGEFRGVFVVEKTGYDDGRGHDAGLLVSPPSSAHVRTAAADLEKRIGRFCEAVGFAEGWLHVEGRATTVGQSELIEINPRFGGRLYRPAVLLATGLDPARVLVSAATGGELPGSSVAGTRSGSVIGMLPFEAQSLGRVMQVTPLEEMRSVPAVVDGYVFDPYTVHSLEYENFFAEFLLVTDDVAAMERAVEEVRNRLSYQVEAFD
ncbi:acetyl-CoA carboxylase biotin carboxylase subunit family protein [Streptomyces sp. CoT10]|uniref:ATP-grasp domain-containing protein n=1 Tax=Streptomyces sp. CoT10 TaxID=2875762 RepID=UPI001CD209B2|nr:ATP-grasp domain-containing protein [Streptomyces sp. CoT10]